LLLLVRSPLTEHTAGQNILRLDRHQVGPGDPAAFGTQAVGLPQPAAVNGVADAAGTGKMRHPHPPLEIVDECLSGLRAKTVHLFGQHELGDGHKLFDVVIWKVQMMRDA
jgi:hypothetical protein